MSLVAADLDFCPIFHSYVFVNLAFLYLLFWYMIKQFQIPSSGFWFLGVQIWLPCIQNLTMASELTLLIFDHKPNGKNYDVRKHKIKVVLGNQDFWNIVTGKEQIQNDSKNKVKFEEWDCEAVTMVILFVEGDIMPHVQDATSANEAWEICRNLWCKWGCWEIKEQLAELYCWNQKLI